jgi:hypothetical protein
MKRPGWSRSCVVRMSVCVRQRGNARAVSPTPSARRSWYWQRSACIGAPQSAIRRSLREIASELAAMGYNDKNGAPYSGVVRQVDGRGSLAGIAVVSSAQASRAPSSRLEMGPLLALISEEHPPLPDFKKTVKPRARCLILRWRERHGERYAQPDLIPHTRAITGSNRFGGGLGSSSRPCLMKTTRRTVLGHPEQIKVWSPQTDESCIVPLT